MKMTAVFSFLLLTWPCLSAQELIRQFDAKDFSAVQIETVSGDVSYTGLKLSSAVVTVRNFDEEKCEFTAQIANGSLDVALKSKKRRGFLSWAKKADSCRAAVNVTGPQRVEITITGSSSDITVSDIAGSLAVSSSSGEVRLSKVAGMVVVNSGSGRISAQGGSASMQLRTGSGDMNVSGLKGSFTGKTGSGSITAQWDSIPSVGEVLAKTGSGPVKLFFPSGTKAVVSTKAGSGKISNELGSSADSKLRITVETGSGDQLIAVK
ncbi:MAG: DUF4097 family beta strand repeat-containing protein [Elusimicrobiaceae bacterium]|jgi:DUF4097 and DUF4098 domain-containing protein YvlB